MCCPNTRRRFVRSKHPGTIPSPKPDQYWAEQTNLKKGTWYTSVRPLATVGVVTNDNDTGVGGVKGTLRPFFILMTVLLGHAIEIRTFGNWFRICDGAIPLWGASVEQSPPGSRVTNLTTATVHLTENMARKMVKDGAKLIEQISVFQKRLSALRSL